MISIIVPVYNAEKYLESCFDAISKQRYTDFEVIVVDDGSKDASGQICDVWAEKDRRFRVFHKKNTGVADTRNYGLKQVTGEYLCFIDADDLVHRDYLSILLKCAEEYNADIVLSIPERFTTLEINSLEKRLSKVVVQCFEQREILREYTKNILRYEFANWGKLFRTEIAQQLTFGAYQVGEDRLFNYQYMLLCEKAAVVEVGFAIYYYRITPGSLTDKRIFDISKIMDCIKAQSRGLDAVQDDVTYRIIYLEMKWQLMTAISRTIRCGNHEKFREGISQISSFMVEKNVKKSELLAIYAQYPFKRKVVVWMDLFFPKVMFYYSLMKGEK